MKRILAALLFLAALAYAQQDISSVTGAVTDPTGASVPGASVQVINLATGIKLNANTNDRGQYTIPALPAGGYRVIVSKAGFKTVTIENVSLIVGVPGTVNAKLEIGQATETVEVTAGAEIVQAQTADVSSNMTGRQLTDLPFPTRDAIELLIEEPGISTPTTPRSSTVNGLPKGALNVTIDGMNTQDNMLKSSDGYFSYIVPSIDAMEEVTLTTSAGGVDSTAQGGSQIKFVTRSGTNQWHGGGFWQVRNTDFNANYYFNNQAYSAAHPDGLPRDVIRLNQEGGHIGGPIFKNKLFFFGNVEIYRFPGTNTYSRTYLTPSASSGVYTYAASTASTGGSGLCSPANNTTSICQVNLLSLAKAANAGLPTSVRPFPTTADPALAKTYALMQQLGANGSVNNNQGTSDYNTLTTSYQPSGVDARDFFTTRIDYNVNQSNVVSLVYNYNWYDAVPDLLNGIVPDFPGSGTVLFSNVSAGQRSNRFDGTLSYRSTITSNLTNEARAGLNGGTVLFFDLVSPGMFSPWRGFYPNFASPGTNLSAVSTTSGPQRRNAPVKNIGDTMNWVHGSHQLSFGFNWDQINVYQQIEGTALIPQISFGVATGDPINSGNTSIFTGGTTGNFPGASSTQLSQAANLYADVVGRVSSISQQLALGEASHQYGVGAPIDRDQMREYGIFVQDQWRIKSNLTATIGLRFEKQGPVRNLDNLYSQVSYAGLWGVSGVGNLFEPGVLPGQAPVYTQIANNAYNPPPVWAPSLGLAWQLPVADGFLKVFTGNHNGAAVLRGGYSIATVREGMNVWTSGGGIYGGNQGLTIDDSVSPTTYPAIFGPSGSAEFSDPTLPSRTSTLALTPSYPISSCSGCSVYGIDPNLKMGYVQSWNLSYQRELSRNTVVDIRFTGNHGTDLWRRVNLNEVNIASNGFFTQFQAAANNLTIARGGNINALNQNNPNYNNYGNIGLPGQVNIPLITTALGTATCGTIGGCSDSTTATYLQYGEAGSFANSIAGNATRMGNLTAAGYPVNEFQVNPLNGGSANVLTNEGASFFDALQVEVRRRLAQGFQITGSYQFAKNLGYGSQTSGTDSSTPTTLRNLGLDKTPLSFDIRNSIKFNWIYEFPLGPGKAFNPSNVVAKKILEGWQISGVVRLQSGTPLFWSAPTNTFDQFNQNFSGVVYHNITQKQLQSMMGVYKTSYLGGSGYQVFYLPPPGAAPTGTYLQGLTSSNNTNLVTNTMAAFGQAGMTSYQLDPNAPYIGPAPAGQLGCECYVYLPWQRHFDLEIQKNMRIHEKIQLQIAASALDVLNLTNFLPGSNIGSSFGQITSAYRDISGTVDPGSRIIEFRARLNF